MSSNFVPSGEAQYRTWLENFADQCAKYETELNLNTQSLAEIDSSTTTFVNSYTTASAAAEELKGLNALKNNNRKSSTAMVRAYAKQFKSIPGISPTILNALGIVATSTFGPVTTVTGLDVTGCDDGVNKLSWNRGTNAPGTMFIVEYRIQGTTSWSFAGAVTKVTFAHDDQVPGQMVWYRVISSRAGENSAPSPAVAAYPNPGDGVITLAA